MLSKEISKTKILILSLSQYQEDSAVITAASENGVESFLAYHIYRVKSQDKSLTLVGNYLDIDYKSNGQIKNIIGSRLLIDNSNLYHSYNTQVFLSFLQEISVALFSFGDPYPTEEVLQILCSLNQGGDILSLLLLLVGVFYKKLGLRIHHNECAICEKKTNLVSYSLEEGGMICKDCQLKSGIEKKDEMDLYVLKFAFMELNATILGKKVPTRSGKKVFIELIQNLIHYFDIEHLRSLSMILDIV